MCTQSEEVRMYTRIPSRNLMGRCPLGDLVVDGRVLKQFLNKQDVRMKIEFNSFRKEPVTTINRGYITDRKFLNKLTDTPTTVRASTSLFICCNGK
jgi:hypothetical protein